MKDFMTLLIGLIIVLAVDALAVCGLSAFMCFIIGIEFTRQIFFVIFGVTIAIALLVSWFGS
jgi:hypothetical protein